MKEMKEMKKIELSKNDNDQMEMRKSLIVDKQREMQKLEIEAQIFSKEYQAFVADLYEKYKLDKDKQYTMKNGFIEEVVEDDKQTKKEK